MCLSPANRHDSLMLASTLDAVPGARSRAERGEHDQRARGDLGERLVDPASGAPGSASRVIYAGVADPTDRHLIRSTDGGRSWQAVAGGPDATMLPVKAAIADYRASLAPLGDPQSFVAGRTALRGGFVIRGYTIKYADRTLRLSTFVDPASGKIEQFLVTPSGQ